MRQVSKKRAKLLRSYNAFVAGMLAVDKRCWVGREIVRIDRHYRECTRTADGLHHLRKKSSGGALMDPDNVLRSCNHCNTWVEDHPTLAWEAGLVVRAGDPDWERLGSVTRQA